MALSPLAAISTSKTRRRCPCRRLRRVLAQAESVEKSTRCRANVLGAKTDRHGPVDGIQGELGMPSHAPSVRRRASITSLSLPSSRRRARRLVSRGK